MTIPNTTSVVNYSGNPPVDGATDTFAYTFKVFDQDHLVVSLIDDTTGDETVQTISTHYTVTGVGNSTGGNVVFVTDPPVGKSVKIARVVPLTQLTDIRNQGSYRPETLEDALDYLTMVGQQAIAASSTVTVSATFTSASRPAASASWLGKFILIDDGAATQLQFCQRKADGTTYEWNTLDVGGF